MSTHRLTVVGALAAIGLGASAQAQCYWTRVGNPGGLDIRALTSWDPDGAGPALALLVAAGTSCPVTVWDGSTWQQLGDAPNNGTALTVYQGTLIVASATTEDGVSRWNGSAWEPMGTPIYSVAAFGIDPNGDLVASTYGSGPAYRWNGASWTPLGASSSQYAMSVLSYAGDLVLGGTFNTNPGSPYLAVGRWTGAAWEALGSNQPPLAGPSFAAIFAHHGYLYYCGASTGGLWHLRSGTWQLEAASNNSATVLNEFHDELIVAGGFTTIGGTPANNIASYNGTTWTSLGLGITTGSILTSTVHNGDLYVAGTLSRAGGLPGFGHIARWTCPACYANCDGSTSAPLLTANDFQCFLNKFAAGDPIANCDDSTATPILTANDFQCFLNRYAAACP